MRLDMIYTHHHQNEHGVYLMGIEQAAVYGAGRLHTIYVKRLFVSFLKFRNRKCFLKGTLFFSVGYWHRHNRKDCGGNKQVLSVSQGNISSHFHLAVDWLVGQTQPRMRCTFSFVYDSNVNKETMNDYCTMDNMNEMKILES